MNAIYAVTLLAACVAAQNFDYRTTTTDLNKLLLKSNIQSTLRDVLNTRINNNNGIQGLQFTNNVNRLPFVQNTNNVVDYNTFDTNTNTNVFTLDEIVRQPLFQRYLTLPLFRIHLSQPLFINFLTTPFFQQYWTIPQFQTFFTNPYLFYKYIYPIVYQQQQQVSVFDRINNNVNNVNNVNLVDDLVNNVNTINNRNGIFNRVDDVITRRNIVPTVDSTIYGNTNIINNNNRLILEKVLRTLFLNKPVTEVVTDVKVSPITNNVDEQVFGKVVDPITGQIKYTTGDINIVDDIVSRRPTTTVNRNNVVLDDIISRRPTTTVDQSIIDDLLVRKPIVDRTLVDTMFVRKPVVGGVFQPINRFNNNKQFNVEDTMLKRLLLNKMMYGDRKINEIYPELMMSNVDEIKTIPELMEKLEMINNGQKLNNVDDILMTRTPVESADLLRKDLLTRVPLTKDIMTEKIIGDKKMFNIPIPTTKFDTLEKDTTKSIFV